MTRSRPAVVAAGVAAAAVLLLGALLVMALFGGGDGDSAWRVSVSRDGGSLVQLAPVSAAGLAARPDDFCLPASPAVGGARVLDCQLTPLIDPASTRCNGVGQLASSDRLCRPLEPGSGDQLLGWVLRADATGTRTLTVYVGAVSPAPGAAVGTASSATLEGRYAAVDENGRWAELAVCPTDLDGNGSVDLVVLGRARTGPTADRPELVVLSVGTSAGGTKDMPVLQTLTFDGAVGRAEGEGCAGPLVRALRYDQRRGLEVDADVLGV